MRFTNRKRRQPPTIIIISLIDILIVLLIFLMVTTTFKQQPAIKLALPESRQAKQGSSENTLVVTINKEQPYFWLGARPVTLEKMQAEFVESLRKNPQVSVAIRLDQQTPFGEFAKVADIVEAVGIRSSMSIYTKRPNQP
jgi:biopolymer transport protein ExbD